MSIKYAGMASAIAFALSSGAALASVPSQDFQHGFYIGINTGASFVTGQTYSQLVRGADFLSTVDGDLGITLPAGFGDTTTYRNEASARGYNGGISIGWDFYCDREFIYGIEASGNLYSNRAHQTWWNIGDEGIVNMDEAWDLTYSAELVFKPGWFVSDSTKLYAIIGGSIAGLNTTLTNLAVNNSSDPVSITDDNQTIWGFVLGAGIQKQLCNRFSAYASYEYTYYGHTDLSDGVVESDLITTESDAASHIDNRTLRIDTNVFKVGVVYTF